MAFTLALLGAECTGKSTLAQQLAAGLREARLGKVVLAAECLREWCQTHGRTPQAYEQTHLARLQAEAIEQAQRQAGPDGWVVADTTPLQTAAYSRTYFGDVALDAPAAAHHARHSQLTLLMGLDLPWQADGQLRDGPRHQMHTDGHLRQLLHTHHQPHQLIYGHGSAREGAAWLALATCPTLPNVQQLLFKTIAEKRMNTSGRALKNHQYAPLCEHCDNAECEHRLFSRLTAARRSPAGTPMVG